MNVTMIDNYDSFTFNLVQYLQQLGHTVCTYRNDEKSAEEIIDEQPDFVVLSPGPSQPENAGVCMDLVKLAIEKQVPVLGVCLGHQAIAQALGAKIATIAPPVHGKTSMIYHRGRGGFKGLPNPLEATRYHSLVVEEGTLDSQFQVTGELETGMIMAIKHKGSLVEGVQFHPESVLTKYGKEMLANFSAEVEQAKGQLAK